MKVVSQIAMLFFVVALAAAADSACADGECDAKDTQVLLQSKVVMPHGGATVDAAVDAVADPVKVDAAHVYHMVEQDVECLSSDEQMGSQATAQDCANAVSLAGGQFFIFGKRDKAGNCWKENTQSSVCEEGWVGDHYRYSKRGVRVVVKVQYDFYSLGNAKYHRVKQDVECASSDAQMGSQATVQDCANAVSLAGGQFFIFGKHDKAGNCWKENTQSSRCKEGWQRDNQYDFYWINHGYRRGKGWWAEGW